MKTVGCAGVILVRNFVRSPQILLVKEHGGLTIPKGHMEAGESPRDTALRELLEETGMPPENVGLLTFGPAYDRKVIEKNGEEVNKKIGLFLGVVSMADSVANDPNKSVWVDVEDFYKKVRSGDQFFYFKQDDDFVSRALLLLASDE